MQRKNQVFNNTGSNIRRWGAHVETSGWGKGVLNSVISQYRRGIMCQINGKGL